MNQGLGIVSDHYTPDYGGNDQADHKSCYPGTLVVDFDYLSLQLRELYFYAYKPL